MHRADKNYEEAIKCYRNALKFDKNNLQILRDLSLLQVQMREFEGYNATRDILLQLQSNQTHMWLGYAVSFHLLKEYDLAIDVIDAYENALKACPLCVVMMCIDQAAQDQL
jgi:peptide alpha-N-acetyltransferase